jgi:hypothetical protein
VQKRGRHIRRHRIAKALLLAAIPLVVAACGSSATTPRDTPVAAPPQSATLDWSEPVEGTRLTFGASRFEVTERGWEARISVDNGTTANLVVGDRPLFGVMLFTSASLDELEQRNAAGELPSVRNAVTFTPPLPRMVKSGARWSGVISAPGALAAGRFVRIVFGPFTPTGATPAGLPGELTWITDNAYRLRR